MPQNLIEKITQQHVENLNQGQRLQSGDFVNIAPAHILTHDNTSAVMKKFKSLKLAYRAAKEGGISPAVLNAANEMAVKAFLEGRIKFTRICDIIEMTMDDIGQGDTVKLDDVVRADMWARETAENFVFAI